jgi:hypothetical protein
MPITEQKIASWVTRGLVSSQYCRAMCGRATAEVAGEAGMGAAGGMPGACGGMTTGNL